MAVPSPVWQVILTNPLPADRTCPTQIGELVDLSGKQFNFGHLRASTCAFTIPLDAPHALDIMEVASGDALRNSDGLLVINKNGTTQMVCEVQTAELTGDDEGNRAIAVTGMETAWVRLTQAYVGQSSAGLLGPNSATDQGTWLNDTLADYNASTLGGTAAATGISTGGTITASGNIAGGVWRYKPYLELMQELAATTSGFDYWFDPLDPTVDRGSGKGNTGRLNIAPVRGSSNLGVVFEYGTAVPNATAYGFQVDRTNQRTRWFSLPPSFPDSSGLKVKFDNATTNAGLIGVREMQVDADLSDPTFRAALLANYKAVTKHAKEVFSITPLAQTSSGLVPEFLVDYDLGDVIQGRIYDKGVELIDAAVRVYGVNVSVDDEGLETDEVIFVNEG